MYRKEKHSYEVSWEKFLSGDNTALSFIYKDIYDKLLNFGMKYSSEQSLVEDCIQNLFIDLLNHRRKLKAVLNKEFYLMKSLKYIIWKEQNKKQKLHLTNIIKENPDNPFLIVYSIEDKIIENESDKIKAEFTDFIKKNLTSHQKEALYLRYNCGFEYKQVAELLGIDIASARTMVYRSIKAIKENFNLNGRTVFLFLLTIINTKPLITTDSCL